VRKGIFFVVSAPSGTGKTTLCHRVLSELYNIKFTTSYTTRQPRPNEVDGQHYYFVSQETFDEMVAGEKFAEHANVYGNCYGTSKEELEGNRDQGRDLLIEIDVQGAASLKKLYPDAVLIFVHPPSIDELRVRLENRATDSEEVIQRRLAIATQELAKMPEYDYLIENRVLEEAVVELKSVITAERRRSGRILQEIAPQFPGALS
jgi:guanylate kinase